MRQTIGVIDYGYAGNVFNIKKSVENVKKDVNVIIVKDARSLSQIDKVILPGVGTYKDVMAELVDMKDELRESILKKPTLGICLGMQILSKKGYEFGETEGLGVIDGEVMRLPVKGRIPHLGWAKVDKIKNSRMLEGVKEDNQFYYMHSYELINYPDVVGLSTYCDHKFVSVFEKDNIFGVQFHPEKSRKSGLKIMENFVNI